MRFMVSRSDLFDYHRRNLGVIWGMSDYIRSNVGFRVGHAANSRLAKAMAFDLKDRGVAAIALWPLWVLAERVKVAAEDKKS